MTHLKFDAVTVQYPVYNSHAMSLRNHMIRLGTGGFIDNDSRGFSIVTALNRVSFELKKGDAVGLIGHNGAGKSTLLRAMAGIYQPVSGTIHRSGTVATLLELGAGLDGELSGQENIMRIGLLQGLSKRQIDEKTREIEDFTELGDFLQLPVRTYSSGMITRLMFAVATCHAPNILLIDEVFGTGDVQFQLKAKQRMQNLLNHADILALASHDHALLKQYCNRFLKLEHGNLSEITVNDF